MFPQQDPVQHHGSVLHSPVPDSVSPTGAGVLITNSFIHFRITEKTQIYSITVKTTSIPAVESAHFCLLNVRSLANKSFICKDFIMTNNRPFLIITESWVKP